MTGPNESLSTKRRKSSLGCIWKYHEQFLIHVICPDNSTLTLIHNTKESFSNVLTNACARLGIAEIELFGLAFHKHNEYQFVPESKCINTLFPKWTVVTGESLTGTDRCNAVADTLIKTCKIYLRVKHVVTSLSVLHPNSVRYLCEQLRWDMIKTHNLLALQGYEDEYIKLAFYSMLMAPCDSSLTESKSVLSHYLPQSVISTHSVEEIASRLVSHSMSLPEMSSLEAQHCFIKLALKLPAVGTHMFQADIFENRKVVFNCWISVGQNSTRIFAENNRKWEQYVKWDVQEVDEISVSKTTATILGYDCEKYDTVLQFSDASKAQKFAKFSKEIQRFDEASYVESIVIAENRRSTNSSKGSSTESSPGFSGTINRKLSWSDQKSSRLNIPQRRASEHLCGLRKSSYRLQSRQYDINLEEQNLKVF